MAHWTKREILRIIADKRIFEFVESLKEVEEYFSQKKFGIAKNSIDLKELINEDKFPVNNQISNLQTGYYYIIDIKRRTGEFKSQNKTVNVAYALYKANKADTYGDTVFQINVSSLLNGTANPLFDNENIENTSDLIGKIIYITRITEGGEKTNSRQVTFTGVDILMTPEDIEKYNVAPTEEDIITDCLVTQWEFEQEEKHQYQSQYETFEFFEEDPSMYFD